MTKKPAAKPAKKSQNKPLGIFGRIRRFFWRLIWRTTLLGLVAGAAFLAVMWLITPDVRDISPVKRDFGIRIYAGDGETLIGSFKTDQADPLTADNLPQNLVNAVLSSEDRRFYWHPGLDPKGLVRAMQTNIQTGRFVQGASTITQQFAKLRYLNSDRTLWRKVQEAVIALKLEWHHSKNDILAAYMNEVFAGQNVYGMSAAAQRYFGTSVHELSDYQAAVLAGMVQAPSRQNPATSEEAANRRAKLVIGAMERDGHITAAEADAYRAQSPNLQPAQVIDANNPDVGYFRDWINTELNAQVNEIMATYGGILQQDIAVYTTLDLNLQKKAAQALENMILGRGLEKNASQAAAVVMDQRGAVLAMVGGTDYRASEYNRAAEAQRQPGSTFKLFVYLSALARGQNPASSVSDNPRSYNGWTPSNYSGRFHGTVTLMEAFTKSYNAAAVNLAEAIGRTSVRKLAAELTGRPLSTIPAGPSVSLGSGELSLLELTSAYGVVSTGGQRLRPFGIEKIIIQNGDGANLASEPVRSSLTGKSDALGNMAIMMRQVVHSGTGKRAKIDDFTYGKTGTSSNFRDAWFVGFQNSRDLGNLIAGVWMGNDDNSPMDGVSGGSLPAELWKQIVSVGSPLAKRLNTLPAPTRTISTDGEILIEEEINVPEFEELEEATIF